ncbi:Rrf2 family transcriptional regulator [Pelagerythrobacter marensis]|uniref:IclR helix-turn-helix domain protein n=1 Tax=Pelagerythrobacter marensis TaxID=543877 RepID=A0A0G3XB03_9SPHN|nr:Rrf2 family transcriptional regulator [Pelagerythrobacter marensis]AKM07816.1 IclR helix-turn-helix domain protein [Pelagerythrobacter marensis]
MSRDTRMARTLHVLIHLDRHVKRATSDDIARMLNTNPVVVRRMMAGLRDRGIVASEKGHGGGWELKRALGSITLLDVYRAIGEPTLFNIGPNAERPDCLVEQAVDARMAETLGEAEALLRDRFESIAVADLAHDFEQRFARIAGGNHADESCSG